MRLIDADTLMKDIKGYKLGKYPKGELEWKIEQQPTIEAAPVERNNIIDEFAEKAMEQFTEFDLKHGYPTIADCKILLKDVAERMKGGAE